MYHFFLDESQKAFLHHGTLKNIKCNYSLCCKSWKNWILHATEKCCLLYYWLLTTLSSRATNTSGSVYWAISASQIVQSSLSLFAADFWTFLLVNPYWIRRQARVEMERDLCHVTSNCLCISSRYSRGLASRRAEIYSTLLSSIAEGLPVHLVKGLFIWLCSQKLWMVLYMRPIEQLALLHISQYARPSIKYQATISCFKSSEIGGVIGASCIESLSKLIRYRCVKVVGMSCHTFKKVVVFTELCKQQLLNYTKLCIA